MGLLVLLAAALSAAASSRAGDGPSAYWDPAWSPDGKQIAFVDRDTGPLGGHGDLYVVDADGSGARRLTSSTGADDSRSARFPTWSPDGGRIAFGYGYDGLFVVNADGTGLRRLVASGCCPDWSPGGRRIAFAQGSETDPARIYVIRPDGTGRTLVASSRDECESFSMPTWSSDGERLAFGIGSASDCDGVTPSLGIIIGYRGRVVRIARDALVVASDPDWSPDGRRIAYADYVTRYRMITVLELRTGKRTKLHRGWHPRWSPDGRKILFSAGGTGIYTMRPDGSHVTRLLPRP